MTERRKTILAACGPSGAGKTTWIRGVVEELGRRGLTTSIVKLCHHDPDIEPDRKDSARHLAAGASRVLLLSPGKRALIEARRETSTEDEIASFAKCTSDEIVIVEGGHQTTFGKIAVAATVAPWNLPPPFPLLATVGRRLGASRVIADWTGPAQAAAGIASHSVLLHRAAGVLGLVLAGGDGRRLGGVAKARLMFHGATLLERSAAMLRAIVPDIAVAAPMARDFSDFPMARIIDVPGVEGPLGGVLAGLSACIDGVLIFGVDHHAVSLPSLARLLDTGLTVGAASLADGSRICPSVSFIARRRLADVEREARRGARSLGSIMTSLRAARICVDSRELLDVDYPEDLSRLSDAGAAMVFETRAYS